MAKSYYEHPCHNLCFLEISLKNNKNWYFTSKETRTGLLHLSMFNNICKVWQQNRLLRKWLNYKLEKQLFRSCTFSIGVNMRENWITISPSPCGINNYLNIFILLWMWKGADHTRAWSPCSLHVHHFSLGWTWMHTGKCKQAYTSTCWTYYIMACPTSQPSFQYLLLIWSNNNWKSVPIYMVTVTKQLKMYYISHL